MKIFNHINVKTIDEATKLLKDYDGKAKLIAGGTDLLGELKGRVLSTYPEALINIKTIPDMDYIREEAGFLKIGALTKLRKVATSPLVKENFEMLAKAAGSVGSPQIRNMGTIGGNLCQDVRCWYYRYPDHLGGRIFCCLKGGKKCYALTGENQHHSIFGGFRVNVPKRLVSERTLDAEDTHNVNLSDTTIEANRSFNCSCVAVNLSDIAAALVALDAKLRISSQTDVRTISVEHFFRSLPNVLENDELMTEIQVPKVADGASQAFIKFRLREAIDFSMASVASLISLEDGVCQDARIVLGAVAPVPMRALEAERTIIGKAIDGATAEAAADSVVRNARPLRKNAHKVQITKTLLKRAILSARI